MIPSNCGYPYACNCKVCRALPNKPVTPSTINIGGSWSPAHHAARKP